MKKLEDFQIPARDLAIDSIKENGADLTEENIVTCRKYLFEAYKQGVKDERRRQAKNRKRKEATPRVSSKRHGLETEGHPDGCRCYPHCDSSW